MVWRAAAAVCYGKWQPGSSSAGQPVLRPAPPPPLTGSPGLQQAHAVQMHTLDMPFFSSASCRQQQTATHLAAGGRLRWRRAGAVGGVCQRQHPRRKCATQRGPDDPQITSRCG